MRPFTYSTHPHSQRTEISQKVPLCGLRHTRSPFVPFSPAASARECPVLAPVGARRDGRAGADGAALGGGALPGRRGERGPGEEGSPAGTGEHRGNRPAERTCLGDLLF